MGDFPLEPFVCPVMMSTTMNETFAPGSLVLVRYGTGTQVVRVRATKKSGALLVDRFLPGRWDGGRWTTSENPVPVAKVLGPMPSADPRAASVMAKKDEPAVAAR